MRAIQPRLPAPTMVNSCAYQSNLQRHQDFWIRIESRNAARHGDEDFTAATSSLSFSESESSEEVEVSFIDNSPRRGDGGVNADSDHSLWKKMRASFCRSSESLLSDYVDPVAERHMTLPGAPPPAKMPPFSFYCQNDKNHKLGALDFFSGYSSQKQDLEQHFNKTCSTKKELELLGRCKEIPHRSTRLLLHRFARC